MGIRKQGHTREIAKRSNNISPVHSLLDRSNFQYKPFVGTNVRHYSVQQGRSTPNSSETGAFLDAMITDDH